MGVKIFSRGFYVSRILCTGNAGFIGSHIVEGLLNQGHTVIGTDDLSGGFLENLPTHKSLNFHKFRFYKQDICDRGAMEEIFMGHKPEVVVHLAANARESASFYDLYRVTRANLYMSSALIELAIK
ncbi:MAG: NAD-dependent epimerase/dehydratase family protein, partial [Candidatus Uhrbacteria bacterium]|nr:NAD-dependent epimerase/dehydratase family protein [Candidatus Uhrbacteria bacterium]